MLAALAIDPGAVPPIQRSAEVIGELRPALVRRFGLALPVPVVLGGADSQACALGAGVVEPGPVSEMAGSSTCLNSVVREPLTELLITHYPHVIPGPFTTETGINTTGAAVAWLADLLYGGRSGHATGRDYIALDTRRRQFPRAPTGCSRCPSWATASAPTPICEPPSQASRSGTAATFWPGRCWRARLSRSVASWSCSAEPAPPPRSCACRVATRGWRRGIGSRPTSRAAGPADPGDAAGIGVAMLAGLGAGVYRNPDEAIARCVRPDPLIEPSAMTRSTYDEAYGAYMELATSTVVRRRGESSG